MRRKAPHNGLSSGAVVPGGLERVNGRGRNVPEGAVKLLFEADSGIERRFQELSGRVESGASGAGLPHPPPPGPADRDEGSPHQDEGCRLGAERLGAGGI